MKMVFSDSEEILLRWYEQSQDYGTNRQRNFYFRGEILYSYGEHYRLALPVCPPHGRGDIVYLVNSWKYSSTTSRHRFLVLGFLRRKWGGRVFEVPNLGSAITGAIDHEENVKYYESRMTEAAERAVSSRKFLGRSMSRLNFLVNEANEYLHFIGERVFLSEGFFGDADAALKRRRQEAAMRAVATRRVRSGENKIRAERKQAEQQEQDRLASFSRFISPLPRQNFSCPGT